MKRKRMIQIIASAIVISISLLSCTRSQPPTEKASETTVTESKSLTNIFKEELFTLPRNFENYAVPAIDYIDGETRIHLTRPIMQDTGYVLAHYVYHIYDDFTEPYLENLDFDSDVGEGIEFFAGESLIVFETIFNEETLIDRCNLVRCSLTDGTTERVENVTSLMPARCEYLTAAVADYDGRIYFTDGSSLCVLNPDLTEAFDMIFEEYVNDLAVSSDGKVYAVGTKSVRPIDHDSRKLGDALDLPIDENEVIEMCYFSSGYDIYYSTDTAMYGYNFGDENSTVVINWKNSNLNSSGYRKIQVISHERMLFTRLGSGSLFNVVGMLNKADDIDLTNVVTVEIAYSRDDKILKRRISEFNQKHPNIRVVPVDYSGYNTADNWNAGVDRLLLEMTSGTYMPDIVFGEIGSAGLIKSVIEYGMYMDMYEFMKNDPDIRRDDIVGAVRTTCEIDGKLSAVIPHFRINTVIASKSALGEKTSWTMEEMLDFEQSLGEDFSLIKEKGKLIGTTYPNFDMLIDFKSRTCNLKNDTFYKLLDYWTEEDKQTVNTSLNQYEEYQMGKTILYPVEYVSQNDFMKGKIVYYPDDYTIIGYPTDVNGYGSHKLINPETYIITADSDCPDEAWTFIKFITLYRDDVLRPFVDFNMLKSRNAEQFASLENSAFFYPLYGKSSWWQQEPDESPLDENGNLGGTQGVYFRYEQSDVDKVTEMLENAGTPVLETPTSEIYRILYEETESYISGRRTIEELADIIQSRVRIWLSEHD